MNVGAVDIGTNSVRLLICDAAGQALERDMVITRLGQGVDRTGALDAAAIQRTTQVLQGYRERLAQHRVTRVRATATSAARDASNRELFFAAAEGALGTRPELLSGHEEAALSFRGATSGLARAKGPFLVIDIGGGSTEFVLGTEAPEAMTSVPMGCVRMTERYIAADPPLAQELSSCAQACRAIVSEVAREIPVQRAHVTIGLAGTVTSLASLAIGSTRYDPSLTHHSRLTRERVVQLCDTLSRAHVQERRAMLAEPKRAEVIVAGAVVLRTIMQELEIDELMVSETDILDGLAASLQP